MEQSNINNFKKILLFLNASSWRAAKTGGSTYSTNADYQGIGSAINFGIEFMIFRLLPNSSKSLTSNAYTMLLVSPFIFHFAIDLIFSKNLKAINQNYNLYFNRYLYISYCILAICGLFYGIYYIFTS